MLFSANQLKSNNTTWRQVPSRTYGPPAVSHTELGKELELDIHISIIGWYLLIWRSRSTCNLLIAGGGEVWAR